MFCRKALFVYWFVVVTSFSPAVWAMWRTIYGDFATSPYKVSEQGGAGRQFQLTFPDRGVVTVSGLSGSYEPQTINGMVETNIYIGMQAYFAVIPFPQMVFTNLVLGFFAGIIGFHLNSSNSATSYISLEQRVRYLWFASLRKVNSGLSVLISDGFGGPPFTMNIVAVERYDSGGAKTIKVTVTYEQNGRDVTLTYLVDIPPGDLETVPLTHNYGSINNPDDRNPPDSGQGGSGGCLSGCSGVIGGIISCCFGSQSSGQGNGQGSQKGSMYTGLKLQLSNRGINPESSGHFSPLQLDVGRRVVKHAVDAGYFQSFPLTMSGY